MAGNMDVYMEPDEVQKIAQGFGQAGDVLRAVSKALEAAMTLLKVTAFVGLVGGMALERFIAAIKPQVDSLAAYCDEINRDLNIAITNYRNGDFEGAGRFG